VACERRWSITVEPAFASLSYNWVAAATARDGASVVLKLGVPNPELSSEIEALRAWAGHGTVRLLEADAADGALLLERLRPGTMLAHLGLERDEEAIDVATDLMRQLHDTAPIPGLRTLADWTSGILDAKANGFAVSIIDRASAMRDELLASTPPSVLLHGDLHHFNILAAERQPWLAIDPKGVIGDPAYEAAPFLYNPMEHVLRYPGADRLVERRIDRFAERFDRRRVIGWALVQSVLSAWWTFEDHGEGHESALEFAEIIQRIR
jgi:streptomycin 6-kinase